MNCENDLCIYQHQNTCMLTEISLNSMGMCEDCILINVPVDVLLGEKRNLLRRYSEDWSETFLE